MIPPMMLRMAIYENGKKKINLWLPLIIAYLILAPFLLVGGILLWMFGGGKTPFAIWLAFYELWCASKGIIIEAQSKNDRVLIRIL